MTTHLAARMEQMAMPGAVLITPAVLEVLAAERLAEQVDRLAHHAVRGEVWEKALAYCRQAGVRAEARSAHPEAVVYFEQALTALAQLPERRDTLEQTIDVRLDLRAAEVLAERLGDDQRLGLVVALLGMHFSATGEYARAISTCQRALALATTSGAFDVQVNAQSRLGQAYYSAGDFRQALDVARRALVLLTDDLHYTNCGGYVSAGSGMKVTCAR
jgi:tetratricopeptide (TPR) repeat protein